MKRHILLRTLRVILGFPTLPPESGGRGLQEFIEGPVKLRKAFEAALKSYVCDWFVRGQQQGLGISHPGHGDIVRQREAGDPFELMGKVIAADVKFL